MQTFGNASKNKDMQTVKVESVDRGCSASNWDIYDTYNAKDEVEDGEEGKQNVLLLRILVLTGFPLRKIVSEWRRIFSPLAKKMFCLIIGN